MSTWTSVVVPPTFGKRAAIDWRISLDDVFAMLADISAAISPLSSANKANERSARVSSGKPPCVYPIAAREVLLLPWEGCGKNEYFFTGIR